MKYKENFEIVPPIEVTEATNKIIELFRTIDLAPKGKVKKNASETSIPIELKTEELEIFGNIFTRNLSQFEKVDVTYIKSLGEIKIKLKDNHLH